MAGVVPQGHRWRRPRPLPLLLLGPVLQPAGAAVGAWPGYACEVPEEYGEGYLEGLVRLNCEKVRRSVEEFSRAAAAAEDFGGSKQWGEWLARGQQASLLCSLAMDTLSIESSNSSVLRGSALHAVNAWGSVVVGGRECCIFLGPPWCVDQTWSTATVFLAVPFLILLLLFAASGASSWLVKRRGVEPQPLGGRELDSKPLRTSEASRTAEVTASRRLHQELEEAWGRCCLRELPGAAAFGQSSASLFAGLCEALGFQPDNVRNQYEHLISLWRSQVAMVADRFVGQRQPVPDVGLLEEALGELHGDLLEGFLRWRAALEAHEAAGPAPEGQVPAMGAARWERLMGSAGEEDAAASAQLAEVSVYLLCWGEAGNLRFMPELLYFLTQLALDADRLDRDDLEVASASGGGFRSGFYLSRIVRPIYNVVFDEWYDKVEVNASNGRDAKKLRANFEKFLPPDVANYDDWNEFFCEPSRFVKGLLLADGTPLFELQRPQRFLGLLRLDWRVSLQAAEVKTHREIHSLWGVFASTHRVWLLHAVLFLAAVVLVTGDAPMPPDGRQALLGMDLPTRLAAVGLVVPFHALLWKFARQQVTGWALRRRSLVATLAEGGMFRAVLWALPALTYVLLRLRDEASSLLGNLTWGVLLALHLIVSGTGFLLLALLPAGLQLDCLPRATSARWEQCHWLMRPLRWVCSSPAGWNLWRGTPVGLPVRAMRYSFWTIVLAVKLVLWMDVLRAVFQASRDLRITLLGRQSFPILLHLHFSTNFLANLLLWLVLWGTAFLLFVADTQLWFTLGCTVLGVLTVFRQRSCGVVSYAREDAIARIPQRFSEKVLQYCTRPGDAMSPHFPALWDRVVEFMRYEDKIDNALQASLSFRVEESGREVTWARLGRPLIDGQRGRRGPAAAEAEATEAEATEAEVGRQRVSLPHVFRGRGYCERLAEGCCGVPDAHFPRNADAQWRILALSRGLGLPIPRPFRAPYIPGFTVLVPHYGEAILMVKRELFQEGTNLVVPLMDWLQARYADEFASFTSRMAARSSDWPVAGTEWAQYTDEQWKRVTSWATMRLQTLWRTVAGMCLYHPALQAHYELQHDRSSALARPHLWNASDVFTCLVSMQMYKFFDPRMLQETERMLEKFPDCLKVAFIDCEDRGAHAEEDGVHPRQHRRYFSCLIDKTCPRSDEGRRQPRFRVELPGYPILGDGKGDNQNHAIPFMRGTFSQCIDANQGAYFEQMMLLPCALGEFRSHRRGDGLAKRIVGFPEHITSDIGSIGDFAASAEVAFGTILQRTYAVLGARMHYGHPDIMNKVFMMQQGGVSKATKTVNLSEDIFAGMDFTLRGEGRRIVHKEYFHLAKGRDLGFNTVLAFFSKLSSGTGEQVLTRQAFRLGQVLHLPDALSFYYAHVGYYFTQFFVSLSMPLLVVVWLLALLSDCEATFRDFQHCHPGRQPAVEVMANTLATMFSWLLLLFLVATSLPLFAEVWMERGIKAATRRMLVSLGTLSPLMFIFQAKVIGSYVTNEFRYGGASYVATGRGLPTERRPFIGEAEEEGLKLRKVGGLYLDYAGIAFYDGAMLLVGACLLIASGGLANAGAGAGAGVFISLGLTVLSWLFAPFVFNPYQFARPHFWRDLRALAAFFLEDSGRHWVDWYGRTQLNPRKGFQTVNDIAFVLVAFFLAAWYGSVNLKMEAFESIFSEHGNQTMLYASVLLPPMGASSVYCIAIVALEALAGCSSIFRRHAQAMRDRVKAMRARQGTSDAEETPHEAAEDELELGEAHAELEDHLVKPAPASRMRARPFWDELRSRVGCSLGVPLPASALVVLTLDTLEAGLTLSNLYRLQWWKGLLAGLILKWALQLTVLFLMEGVLRAQIFHRAGAWGLPLQLFVHSHKMLRDMFTSLLIFWALAPWVAFNDLNDFLCPGCNLHLLLLYRDPGHLQRREAEFAELPESPSGARTAEASAEPHAGPVAAESGSEGAHAAAQPLGWWRALLGGTAAAGSQPDATASI